MRFVLLHQELSFLKDVGIQKCFLHHSLLILKDFSRTIFFEFSPCLALLVIDEYIDDILGEFWGLSSCLT
ncbi:hypothetical protein Gotri_024060 [Gossypium trilobum]|uniref:Uncharacterized protein n=1 Tax=Gossypium trilobum TaxID=34281 RepID=A0A7J9DL67_9ROSI|nr:hypothetical protein [Gossypium trilobum]